jgi:arylsulfatase A-like enzyme
VASLLVLAAAVAVPPAPVVAAPPDRPPNILVIVTDDQRVGTMSVMEDTRRWFQAKGTRFSDAYVTTPLCCPARASIFTGRYAHNHGVRNNVSAGSLDQRSTIQRYLRQAGYRTAMAGKYFNGWDLSEPPPYFQRSAVQKWGYHDAIFGVNGTQRRIPGYSTTFIRKKALDFLNWFEEQDATPWLLFVAPFAPHGPFEPEKRYAHAPVPPWTTNPAIKESDLSDKPPFLSRSLTAKEAKVYRRQQLRTLMSVDDLVDGLMRELGRLNERHDTLAFYLSDNGYFWGEHGQADKRLPYTPSVRIPLLMRWPEHVAPGGIDGRPVANVDLVPTIMEAAGIAPAPGYPLDGRSLLGPAIRDHTLHEYFVDGDGSLPEWGSIRTGTYQYAEYYDDSGATSFREYYDLESDPWQLQNLLHDGDPANDPSALELERLSTQLRRDRLCQGTEGSEACP